MEKVWLRSQQNCLLWSVYDQCRAYRSDLEKAETDYHCTQISQCDIKRLFRMVDQMTTVKRDAVMPPHTSDSELANHFASFFDDKKTRLRRELDSTQPTELSVDVKDSCNSSLPKFSAVSEDDVREVLKTSASKSSDLDPLPAKLFKQCQEELLPVITEVINKSLESGVVPPHLSPRASFLFWRKLHSILITCRVIDPFLTCLFLRRCWNGLWQSSYKVTLKIVILSEYAVCLPSLS